MLDGRIDVQGMVKELQAYGALDSIVHDSDSETPKQEGAESVPEDKDEEDQPADAASIEKKKPRKLVKDEERETGRVKWLIYKTYLKAS